MAKHPGKRASTSSTVSSEKGINYVSESFCSSLVNNCNDVSDDFDFPKECRKFDSFRMSSAVLRRDSKDRTKNKAAAAEDAYAGMDPVAAVKAQTARKRGHLNPAQNLRRMTTRNNPRQRSWFDK